MKHKTKKLNKQEKQNILCDVVSTFIKNGISNNDDIVKICYELNSDKLRGVKRSLTLKKQKNKKHNNCKIKAATKAGCLSEKSVQMMPKINIKNNKAKTASVPVFGVLTPQMRQYILFNQLAKEIDALGGFAALGKLPTNQFNKNI